MAAVVRGGAATAAAFTCSWTVRSGWQLSDIFSDHSGATHTTSSAPPLSSPSVEGSGIGPSIAHLFVSYLVRMKFSILLD